MASPGQLQRPCLAAGHLPAGNGSACLSAQSQEAHSTLGVCDWRVRCSALHRLRRRFYSATATTTTAGNAARNFHDHSDCYQLQFKRTAGKYARHVDRQVMADWKGLMGRGRVDLNPRPLVPNTGRPEPIYLLLNHLSGAPTV